MGKSVRTLLNNALYLSIADRQFDPIGNKDEMTSIALNTFVDVLDMYREEVPFGMSTNVVGLDKLDNFEAADVTAVLYLLGSLKYNLKKLNREEFSTASAIISLQTIPSFYFYDIGEKKINIYPVPTTGTSDTFFIDYSPLYNEDSILLDVSIDERIVPRYMQLFLEYELAQHLCVAYSVPWTAEKEAIRVRTHMKLIENSDYRAPAPKILSFHRSRTGNQLLDHLTKR